jgi:hypothetical protein
MTVGGWVGGAGGVPKNNFTLGGSFFRILYVLSIMTPSRQKKGEGDFSIVMHQMVINVFFGRFEFGRGNYPCWPVIAFWPGYQPVSGSKYQITYLPGLRFRKYPGGYLPSSVWTFSIPINTLLIRYYFGKKKHPTYTFMGLGEKHPGRLFIQSSSMYICSSRKFRPFRFCLFGLNPKPEAMKISFTSLFVQQLCLSTMTFYSIHIL